MSEMLVQPFLLAPWHHLQTTTVFGPAALRGSESDLIAWSTPPVSRQMAAGGTFVRCGELCGLAIACVSYWLEFKEEISDRNLASVTLGLASATIDARALARLLGRIAGAMTSQMARQSYARADDLEGGLVALLEEMSRLQSVDDFGQLEERALRELELIPSRILEVFPGREAAVRQTSASSRGSISAVLLASDDVYDKCLAIASIGEKLSLDDIQLIVDVKLEGGNGRRLGYLANVDVSRPRAFLGLGLGGRRKSSAVVELLT